MRDSEGYGQAHTLVVTSVTLPIGSFDPGEMQYEIQHPDSCPQESVVWDGEPRYTVWTCDVGQNESECGLPWSLQYSGTPITEPGTYQIQAWWRKYYVWDTGYEYDSGIGVIADDDA